MNRDHLPALLYIIAACLPLAPLAALAQPDAAAPVMTTDAILARLHPPVTQSGDDRTPRPYTYVEPPALDLPSDEDLATTEIRGRTFHIRRVPQAAYQKHGDEAVALYQNDGEALYFRGSGGGGRFSRERLVIEDCTFVIDFEPGPFRGGDFEDWDPKRAAIYVEGYNEVVVRNSVFVSRMTKHDPIRKVIGSVVAYDCLKLQVDDCYFEGLTTGWRGHILAWGCGPTHVRNVEIAGQQQGDQRVMGGGIWVAHGEKIGWTHGGDPDRMIYPNGPLRIENAWVHDQEGKENTDGIYIQSIQPYLVRNTRVENWKGQDSLIDLGFRDTFQRFNGERMANHGAVGVVEHSHFASGYVKDSVGVAGGLVFRHNVLDDAWIFPYVFDGGNWYVLGNLFTNLSGVVVSGRNNQLSGWTPKEGMFARGSRMLLYGNRFENRAGARLAALYVNNSKNSPLRDVIAADHNIYAFDPAPEAWALDQATGETWATLDAWRSATGNDAHSVVGDEPISRFSGLDPASLPFELPGGLSMSFTETPGLVGPVGVQNAEVLERARRVSDEAKQAFDQAHLEFEAEALGRQGDGVQLEERGWASGGAMLLFTGDELTLELPVDRAGRFKIITHTASMGGDGQLQLLVDGEPLGKPFPGSKRGATGHGAVDLAAGSHTLTYRKVSGGGRSAIDRIDLRGVSSAVEEGMAALADRRQAAAERRRALAEATVTLEAEAMKVVEKSGWVGVSNNGSASGGKYLLLAAKKLGDFVTISGQIDEADGYRVAAVTVAQADKGQVQLEVDGQPVGSTQPLSGRMEFGRVALDAGEHRFTLRLVEGKPEVKVRLDRLDLVPADAGD